jgi:hypothetical protein
VTPAAGPPRRRQRCLLAMRSQCGREGSRMRFRARRSRTCLEDGIRDTCTWHEDEDDHVLSCTVTRTDDEGRARVHVPRWTPSFSCSCT